MAEQSAREILLEKLEALRRERAISADAAQSSPTATGAACRSWKTPRRQRQPG